MNEYDIQEALKRIENELIASMIQNMDRHRAEETKEGFEWGMWQAEQLKALEEYKKRNKEKYKDQFGEINSSIPALISESRKRGYLDQEAQILESIRKGSSRGQGDIDAPFFQINDRKMNALIDATVSDMDNAETAMLRRANDQYRKTIFNAQVYANSGVGTYEKAVDMATKDFLAAGIQCIQYKNGSMYRIEEYAGMAIRTASKRAYLTGEGEKRKEWGCHLVIMNKRGNPCPKCLPFVGKILIDDVWSGGSSKDGSYPLMSSAMAAGLYHPNCKDGHTTYFPGISTPPDDKFSKEEIKKVEDDYKGDQKQQYAKRQKEKFRRLANYSLDRENKEKYEIKLGEWKEEFQKKAEGFNIKDSLEVFKEKIKNNIDNSRHKANMSFFVDTVEFVEDQELKVPFAYLPNEDIIKYNSKAPNIELYDMDYVFSHEITHRMDFLQYNSWKDERFLQEIEKCRQKVYDKRDEVQEWFQENGKYEYSFAISDIISALSEGEIIVPVGHKKSYWKSNPKVQAMEIFANLSSIDVLELDEKEKILDGIFKAYKELVE